MNRSKEFFEITGTPKIKKTTKRFYDEILEKIEKFEISSLNYSTILKNEEKFLNLVKKLENLFLKIKIDNKNLKLHFDGIKENIEIKIYDKLEMIKKNKKKFLNKNLILEAEKPKIILENQIYEKNFEFKNENKKILKDKKIEKFKQNLEEIQILQKKIKFNLICQNESIENIYLKSKNIKKDLNLGNKMLRLSKDKKRLFRRFLHVWLLCLAFLLLFVHFDN